MTHPHAAILVALLVSAVPAAADEFLYPDSCDGTDLRVQVLGSGGDFADGRAASSYLVWIGGNARVLIDAGAGSALRFVQSDARIADIDAMLFTQLNADRALDVPALLMLAMRQGRTRALPLYGPTGNRQAPSTVTFVRTLLDGTRGAYRQLSGVLSPLAKDGFKLQPHDVRTRTPGVGVRRSEKEIIEVSTNERFRAAATYNDDDGPPLLAWRVRAAERSIVISGPMDGEGNHMEQLARGADLLIVDHPLSQLQNIGSNPIGRLAAKTQAKRLVLSRLTRAALDTQDRLLAGIRKDYAGPIAFAHDLDCFALP